MENILDYKLSELKKWMKDQGESEFRAKQAMDCIYKGIWSIDEFSNIGNVAREKLKQNFYVGVPKVVAQLISKHDDTRKFLYEFQDGNIIESVVMKYKHGYSICVSTQVGCRMGCTFCASTLNGMVRNLTAGEILAQIIVAQKEIGCRISNVVMMGSGEPLDNFDNTIKFLELVNAEYGLNIGQRHITLSTCGLVNRIMDLADMDLQITLAISLHAAENDKRKNMMPIGNKYSIEEVLDACKYYISKTNKRITFEYALVKDVNDNIEDAEKLSKLLSGMLCHVNLIPVNEIKENNYKTSDNKNIEKFCKALQKAEIETTIRREMGADINAACGQLRRSYIEGKG